MYVRTQVNHPWREVAQELADGMAADGRYQFGWHESGCPRDAHSRGQRDRDEAVRAGELLGHELYADFGERYVVDLTERETALVRLPTLGRLRPNEQARLEGLLQSATVRTSDMPHEAQRPSPSSFARFTVGMRQELTWVHHWLSYRLTDIAGEATEVEVWDLKAYDH